MAQVNTTEALEHMHEALFQAQKIPHPPNTHSKHDWMVANQTRWTIYYISLAIETLEAGQDGEGQDAPGPIARTP